MIDNHLPWVSEDPSVFYQWGHAGRHHGIGTPECPFELHHHHDEHCDPPPLVILFDLMSNALR